MENIFYFWNRHRTHGFKQLSIITDVKNLIHRYFNIAFEFVCEVVFISNFTVFNTEIFCRRTKSDFFFLVACYYGIISAHQMLFKSLKIKMPIKNERWKMINPVQQKFSSEISYNSKQSILFQYYCTCVKSFRI